MSIWLLALLHSKLLKGSECTLSAQLSLSLLALSKIASMHVTQGCGHEAGEGLYSFHSCTTADPPARRSAVAAACIPRHE